ncbi:leucine rich repeat protein [Ochromonadaceae sp. CCMP2298]|nr:leucine rich repeat protein [Ochromonadaceae sp. CCMP2298]
MNLRLMREFEEFEGLGSDVMDDAIVVHENEDDDSSFRPAQAAVLTSNDIYYELDKRNMKTTGFPDTDKEMLQRVFDEEFKNDLEDMRARRREKQLKAAQQMGLQKRRMLMERTLQEEQDELARSTQIGLMIQHIKENMVANSLRLEVNSVSARSLAKAMWVNDTITCLDLSFNKLDDHAGCYLARILKRNSTLRKIELDNNKLGARTCAAFGDSLVHNSSLSYLSLDSNEISTFQDQSGIKALADAIRVNRSLTSLNLWRTSITAAGGELLANGIEENSTLLFCDVGHNMMEMGDVKRVVERLDGNLEAYEQAERQRRQDSVMAATKQKALDAVIVGEAKQEEESRWLQERRDLRATDRRKNEQERILRVQEEMYVQHLLLAWCKQKPAA